jgi:hypothetical protein
MVFAFNSVFALILGWIVRLMAVLELCLLRANLDRLTRVQSSVLLLLIFVTTRCIILLQRLVLPQPRLRQRPRQHFLVRVVSFLLVDLVSGARAINMQLLALLLALLVQQALFLLRTSVLAQPVLQVLSPPLHLLPARLAAVEVFLLPAQDRARFVPSQINGQLLLLLPARHVLRVLFRLVTNAVARIVLPALTLLQLLQAVLLVASTRIKINLDKAVASRVLVELPRTV